MKRFDVGSRVIEPTYGLGSVVAVEDNYTRVQFGAAPEQLGAQCVRTDRLAGNAQHVSHRRRAETRGRCRHPGRGCPNRPFRH